MATALIVPTLMNVSMVPITAMTMHIALILQVVTTVDAKKDLKATEKNATTSTSAH